MKPKPITPKELGDLLSAGWETAGFQQTLAPVDLDASIKTDGYAILLKRKFELAIVMPAYDKRSGAWQLQILFLTGTGE